MTDGLPGDEVHALVAKRLAALGIEGDEPIILMAHFLVFRRRSHFSCACPVRS